MHMILPSRCFILMLVLLLFAFLFKIFILAANSQLAGSHCPDQGLTPGPQQWKRWVLTTRLPENTSLVFCFMCILRASQVAVVVKNLPANAGDIRDVGLIPGSGRSSGVGNDSSLQYSCLENPMDRGVWQATVRGVSKSRARLKHAWTHAYVFYTVNFVIFSFPFHRGIW